VRGLGKALAAELSTPAVGDILLAVHPSGFRFGGTSRAAGYAAVLWARTAIRALVEVGTQLDVARSRGRLSDTVFEWVRDGVAEAGGAEGWAALVPRGATFAVDARVGGVAGAPDGGASLTRSIGLAVKDAVCDALVGGGVPKPDRSPG